MATDYLEEQIANAVVPDLCRFPLPPWAPGPGPLRESLPPRLRSPRADTLQARWAASGAGAGVRLPGAPTSWCCSKPQARKRATWDCGSCRSSAASRNAAMGRPGALTTYTEVMQSAILQKAFPLLCRAPPRPAGLRRRTGAPSAKHRERLTAADTPPALLVYRAELELVSLAGTRRVIYDQFHRATRRWISRPAAIARASAAAAGAMAAITEKVGTGARRPSQSLSGVVPNATWQRGRAR